MAYQMHYWADDNGKGEFELKCVRLKSIDEIQSLSQHRPIGTVLITVDRTDRQSEWEKQIWRDPNYPQTRNYSE